MADATYGGFWIRVLAYAADMSILTLGLLLLAVPLTFMGGAGMGIYALIVAVGPIAYFAWLQASSREATIGKQLCGLKVQHEGAQISLLRSIARELAKLLSSAVLMIGFLMVAFTGRKQGLHDMLASTEVVREGQPRIIVAILVALAGVLIPVIVVPLMFGALFAGMMAMMMGGAVDQAVKQSRPVPRLEQKAAAPRAPAPVPQPAPQAAAKAPAAEPAKPAVVEPAKPAAAEAAKPVAIEAPKPAPTEPPKPVAAAAAEAPAPAAPSVAATRRSGPATAKSAAPVMQQGKPPCVYKPVMTDEEIDRCR